MARKEKLIIDDEFLAKLEALASVLSKEQIADYFGIGKVTYYNYEKKYPEIGERYKKGKARAVAKIAQTVISQAVAGNLTAAFFYLKTQAGWREKSDLNLTSDDGSMSPQKGEEKIQKAVLNALNRKHANNAK